jgi:hypothetical protein
MIEGAYASDWRRPDRQITTSDNQMLWDDRPGVIASLDERAPTRRTPDTQLLNLELWTRTPPGNRWSPEASSVPDSQNVSRWS